MTPSLLEPVRRPFRALSAGILPEAVDLDPIGWQELERIVCGALATRPEAMVRQLLLFIRLADWLALLPYGRPFTRYDVVVIGSGAGGGTVAEALVPIIEQGGRVIVFEQGPRLDDEEFTGDELEMPPELYEDGGPTEGPSCTTPSRPRSSRA